MVLVPGATLAHYRIVSELGAGAMGQVYRAHDTRLERDVAIKVLPVEFAEDEERLARFEREAKSLAALNHPNVAQIFGVDQIGDTCFLVLELVPGETLEERLRRGPLPVEEALDVCRQVAEGLEAAHESGVVHRDLKPANVRITPEGKVKVLDFGLAKPMRAGLDPRSSDSVLSTEQGRLLGTPTYMAPEQARGRAIDRRVDVWALGCVMLECLTGKRPFEGESLSDVLGAILRDEPDLARLPVATPVRVRELIARCLTKDPRQRLRDAGEARIALERALAEPEGAPAAARRPARLAAVPWVVALVFAALWARAATRGSEPPRAQVHLAVRVPPELRLASGGNNEQTGVLTLAPNAARLAFVAYEGNERRIYLRDLASPAVTMLAGTEDASAPFFSPDGRWIAFFANGKLKKVALAGGQPIELCEVSIVRGGAWGPDDSIVFTPSQTAPLFRIPSSGGTAVELTKLDPARNERSHRWPAFLPGGREVAFTIGQVDKPGDYENSVIEAVSLETGKRRPLVAGASMTRVLGADRLVFGRLDQLFVQTLAETDGGALGPQRAVLEGVAGVAASGVLHCDVAGDSLAYLERDPRASLLELAWVLPDGTVEPLAFPAREYQTPRISPDGKRVAVSIGPGGGRTSDVWILDLERATSTRLTFDVPCATPTWTADGERVMFSHAANHGSFSWKRADGGDDGDVLAAFDDSQPRFPVGITPDGGLVPYVTQGKAGTSQDLFYWSRADGTSHALASTPASENYCALSPDGAWLAYTTDESGTREVYVQSFPERRGRWQVSDGGGLSPCWSRDGRELYFVVGRKLVAVPVTTAGSFVHGSAHTVAELDFIAASESVVNYDVAPDGRVLVVRSTSQESYEHHVNVVLGWGARLGE